MPKVTVHLTYTKTEEVSFEEEISVPKYVLENDELFEWLEKESQHKLWQGKGDTEDESFELNEAFTEED